MDTVADDFVAVLALEDGAIFYGRPFGALRALHEGRGGEVVFNTSMTGYQEVCTDPSYHGQMVVLTSPLVGNYGVASEDLESRRPWLSALLVRELATYYSSWRAAESLDGYLLRHGIAGVCELDTRAITRYLREARTMRGVVRLFRSDDAINHGLLAHEARSIAPISDCDLVSAISSPVVQPCVQPCLPAKPAGGIRGIVSPGSRTAPRIALIDTGYKEGIARALAGRDLDVLLTPHTITLAELLALRPDGLLLANGPGDPATERSLVALVRELFRLPTPLPLMGICLGHQILALAAGGRTSRLPFGHHGANHPVLELRTGRVTIVAQNHDFQVDAATLPRESGLTVSHINLCDGSVEGLEHRELPIFSVQFHPEACPGPGDNLALFDRFVASVRSYRRTLVA